MYVELEIMPGKGGVTAHSHARSEARGTGKGRHFMEGFWGAVFGSPHSAAYRTTTNTQSYLAGQNYSF